MTDLVDRPVTAAPLRSAPAHRAPGGRRPPRRGEVSGRRADIEGLRAVAVLGVLAFHAGIPFIPGGYVGVDVFFVISGFLITGLVAAELSRTGQVSFARFYARRIKRLLPAAVLVLVVTAVFSALILSPLARGQAGSDIVSAALYVSNWHFAMQQTDYLAANANPSPVLHFWSLSVEEQYYVLWPLVLVATFWWARRRSMVVARAVLGAVVGIGLVSLVWSIVWTGVNPPFAFFGTMTRAWELALGGVLALTAVAVGRLPAPVKDAIGWLGLAAIVWSMLSFTEEVPFPGTAALVPALGAAAVIAGGLPRPTLGRARSTETGAGLTLGLPPMRSVGRVSYSLYLWHWPPLVLVPVVLGAPLSPLAGTIVVVLSAIPAVLSFRYVEEPFRHSRTLVDFPRRAAVVAAVLTTVAVLSGVLLARLAPPSDITVDVAQSDGSVMQVMVDPLAAREDVPRIYRDKCEAGYPTTKPRSCVYGDKSSDRRVALLGDSHAAQWFPPLVQLADANGWALEVDSKSSCSSGDVTQYHEGIKRDYTECPKFREALLKRWERDPSRRPDVVVVANRNSLTVTEGGQRLDPLASLQAQQAGLERTFKRLAAMDVKVVLVGDVLALPYDVPDCLSAHSGDPSACDFNAADMAPLLAADRLAAQAAGVPVIEPAAGVCSEGRCAVIQDGMVVYRDSHHLTATYTRSLAEEFGRELAKTSAWKRLQG